MARTKWFPFIFPVVFPLLIPLVWPGALMLVAYMRDHHPVHGVVYEREFEPGHPIGMAYAGDRYWIGVKLDKGGEEEILVDHREYVTHPPGTRYDRDWKE